MCFVIPFTLDVRLTCGRTSRGHTGGRSRRISPPSFCGVFLHFYAFISIARKRIQPSLSLVDREVECTENNVPDIVLLTRCYYHHRGIGFNAMESFRASYRLLLCFHTQTSWEFPPLIGGRSEGFDAFSFFFFLMHYLALLFDDHCCCCCCCCCCYHTYSYYT